MKASLNAVIIGLGIVFIAVVLGTASILVFGTAGTANGQTEVLIPKSLEDWNKVLAYYQATPQPFNQDGVQGQCSLITNDSQTWVLNYCEVFK